MPSEGKVAVTGATGHLGANLVVDLLARGHDVRAVTLEPVDSYVPALEGLEVERVQADVCDSESIRSALEGADIVYHLAARISILPTDLDLVRRVNVDGVANVIEACRRNGVRRLVHTSSIYALDPSPAHRSVGDDRALNNEDSAAPPYNRSKAEGERLVWQAVDEGLDAVVVSPTGMMGPRDWRPSHGGRMLLDLWRKKLPVVAEGGFNWVDVRDVASALIAAAANGKPGQRYVVGGHWASIAEVCEIASAIGSVRKPSMVAGHRAARWIARLATAWYSATGRDPRITGPALDALSSYRLVLAGNAVRDLHHSPRSLEDTIEDTYRWFVAHDMVSTGRAPRAPAREEAGMKERSKSDAGPAADPRMMEFARAFRGNSGLPVVTGHGSDHRTPQRRRLDPSVFFSSQPEESRRAQSRA